jgi:hypothetical protein
MSAFPVYVVFDFYGVFELDAACCFASLSFFRCITLDTMKRITSANVPAKRMKLENFLSLSKDAPSSSVV